MAQLAAALLAAAAAGAGARGLRIRGLPDGNGTSLRYIPKTNVLMPWNYEDYTRGHEEFALYPDGKIPGKRVSWAAPGEGCPAFNAERPDLTPEEFTDALPTDYIGAKCAPGGDCAGHYFYNVVKPTLLSWVVPEGTPGRTDAAFVVTPGGGGVHLAWEGEAIAMAEWLNSMGISAFLLKYRVPDHTDELIYMDAQRAMSLVRSRAAQYGLNASRIGITGNSMGGKAALTLGTRSSRAYDRIDEVDDVPFRPDFIVSAYPALSGEILMKVQDLPATFVAYTDDDPCCDARLTRILEGVGSKAATRPFMAKSYKRGGHAWAFCEYYPQVIGGLPVCSWKDHALEFMNKHVLYK